MLLINSKVVLCNKIQTLKSQLQIDLIHRKHYSKTEKSEIGDKREQNKSNVVVVVAAVNYTRNRESVVIGFWKRKVKARIKMSVAVSNSTANNPCLSPWFLRPN